MNLLLYSNRLCGGGAERVMSVLGNELCRLGHKVTLVTDYESPDDYYLIDSVDRVVLDGEYKEKNRNAVIRTWRRIRTVRHICKNENIDIVLSFLPNVNFRSLLATIGLKTKNVMSVRNDPRWEYSDRIIRFIASVLYRRKCNIVFQTEIAKKTFPWKIKGESIVIANPVSKVFFEQENNSGASNRIITAGRLTEQKNIPMLIESFFNISQKYLNATLEIYGSGHLKDRLNNLIDELGMNGKARLQGNISNLASVFESATIFVLCSDYEGMPNVLMEAMAMGVPCIATDCDGGGARFLIEDGKTGFLIPKGDIGALVEKMDLLLSSKSLREAIGNSARQQSIKFRQENIVKQWEEFLFSVLEKK